MLRIVVIVLYWLNNLSGIYFLTKTLDFDALILLTVDGSIP
jgi:hypothetical protein